MEFEYAPLATPARGLELRTESRHGGALVPAGEAKQSELFYGWLMVPLATLVMICSAPGQTYGFMRFNPSIRESLSLSQTDLSATYLLATLCAAIPLSYLGRAFRSVWTEAVAADRGRGDGGGVPARLDRAERDDVVRRLPRLADDRRRADELARHEHAGRVVRSRNFRFACGIMQFGMAASMALVPVSLMLLIGAVGLALGLRGDRRSRCWSGSSRCW